MYALFLHGDLRQLLTALVIFVVGLVICGVIAYRLNKSWKGGLK